MHVLHRKALFAADRPVFRGTWDRRGGFPAHAHEFFEFTLITAGRGAQEREGGEDELAAGDLLLLRPGDWHAYRHAGRLAGIDCALDPALLHSELAWTAADPHIGPLLWGHRRSSGAQRLRPADPAPLVRLFAALAEPAGRAGRIGAMLGILDAVGALLPADAVAIHPAAAEAARLMAAEPAKPWTLGGLALRLGQKPAYFCRIFARDFGLPPRAWLLRRRIELAQRLLLRGEASITEIAGAAGWRDPGVFSRCFRAQTGLSASRWRVRYAQAGNLLGA